MQVLSELTEPEWRHFEQDVAEMTRKIDAKPTSSTTIKSRGDSSGDPGRLTFTCREAWAANSQLHGARGERSNIFIGEHVRGVSFTGGFSTGQVFRCPSEAASTDRR